jgi:hypothetical protein
MTTTIRSYFTLCLAVAALFAMTLYSSSAQAGTVSFDDIVQTTQTPGDPDDLYGTPDTSIPNKLSFPHPNAFAATAVGSGGVDVTDGFLTFTVNADPGTWATGISLVESGSWSLIPEESNSAGVRGNGSIRVTEVDGLPAAGPIFPILFSEDFDQSNTPPDSQNWVGGFAQGFGSVNGRVTAFEVSMDNRLFAISEGGFSFIDKKNITFMVRTEMVPEPSTALLGVMAFSGLGLIAARRRG